MKYQWTNKLVLFAENDEASSIHLNELLKIHNAIVIHSSSVLQAITHCMNNPSVDLVIMDMRLPEMDGYEAVRLIKKYRPSLPVIAVTACAKVEDKRRCVLAGCDGYLSKPVTSKEFLPMVNFFLNSEKSKVYQVTNF